MRYNYLRAGPPISPSSAAPSRRKFWRSDLTRDSWIQSDPGLVTRPALENSMVATVVPSHPHRTIGIALLAFGFLLLIGGIVAASYCSLSFLGVCLDNPYQGVGYGLIFLGILLLVIGLVLAIISGPVMVGPTPVLYAQPQPVYYVSNPLQQIAPQPPTPGAERYCPSCGAGCYRLSVFCNRCGKPLPPPT